MTIILEQEYDRDLGVNYKEIADRVINYALDYEKCPYEAEISLTLTDNDGIHAINKETRNMDTPTDVLSFPNVEFETEGNFEHVEDNGIDCFDPDSGELILGDIIINVDRVVEQAHEYGHSIKREFAFLIAHSMFHLCGYDHMNEHDEKIMFAKQEEVLTQLGITRE